MDHYWRSSVWETEQNIPKAYLGRKRLRRSILETYSYFLCQAKMQQAGTNRQTTPIPAKSEEKENVIKWKHQVEAFPLSHEGGKKG